MHRQRARDHAFNPYMFSGDHKRLDFCRMPLNRALSSTTIYAVAKAVACGCWETTPSSSTHSRRRIYDTQCTIHTETQLEIAQVRRPYKQLKPIEALTFVQPHLEYSAPVGTPTTD